MACPRARGVRASPPPKADMCGIESRWDAGIAAGESGTSLADRHRARARARAARRRRARQGGVVFGNETVRAGRARSLASRLAGGRRRNACATSAAEDRGDAPSAAASASGAYRDHARGSRRARSTPGVAPIANAWRARRSQAAILARCSSARRTARKIAMAPRIPIARKIKVTAREFDHDPGPRA